ncbi:MAG: LysR family transcriptional regulator [Pseudomonadota bacterium]
MDTFANLKAFLAVSRTGSFAAAARELKVAPSVITKRISQIEWRLKSPLFERSTRRVSLTQTGQRYLPTVQRLMADMDDLFSEVQGSADTLQGSIRIKVPGTVAAVLLGPLLDGFAQAFPLIRLEVMALERAVNPMDEGFDVAFTLIPSTFGGVLDIPLCAMPRHLCASPAYLSLRGTPLHPAELADHETLNFLPSGNAWEFASSTGPARIDLQPRLNTNEARLLLSAALAGNGIAILGAYLAAPALQDGSLVRVLDDYPIADLWLRALVPESRVQVARVQALLDWMQSKLANRFAARPQNAKGRSA